ncbi:NTP pyrophosphohydrolase [Candidatus Nitrososphaera evergladensis SR1]|uniref:NTP pyrophosphohydrolase n=1 Tax=Candidatus Nitrososphaera evergladensis SR1 TaxID=1459636 RepID=A0A075MLV5_9ARCH|nr:NUDIX hydrolase [Candidatus Nitrososphaera evergladensis]AIF82120.1 NTP pyrophosphohydrolase [Candidatus Nitrososphaera evergladensis SR1]
MKNAPEGWKILSSKKVYGHRYLSVYEDEMDLAGKRKKTYIRGRRLDYSTIVPFSDDAKSILTIKSYRHLVDSYQVEVPSGYIEKGESPLQAARRELEEETGYVAKKMVLVGSYTLDYSMFEQTGNVFAAYGLEDTGTKRLGSMEKISQVSFVPVQRVKKMLLEGRILNAASIVALYRAIHYNEAGSGEII